jgi:hypothetical protein
LKLSSVSGRPSFQSEQPFSSLLPRRRVASAVRSTTMLTRGVCRSMPTLRGVGSTAPTTPLATSPLPPSFSLAKTKIASPTAMRLPSYIVFCSANA